MQGVIFLGFAQGSILDAIQTWKCNLEGRDVSFFLVSVKHSWQAVYWGVFLMALGRLCFLDGCPASTELQLWLRLQRTLRSPHSCPTPIIMDCTKRTLSLVHNKYKVTDKYKHTELTTRCRVGHPSPEWNPTDEGETEKHPKALALTQDSLALKQLPNCMNLIALKPRQATMSDRAQCPCQDVMQPNHRFFPPGMCANISGIMEDWLGRRTGKWKGPTLMMSSTDVLHVLFDLRKNFVSA